MSWEIVPDAGRPAGERRFPWWIVLAVGIIVIAAGAGLLVWPFVAASWLLVVLFGSALIANGLALLVRRRATTGGTVAGLLLVLAGVLAMVFSEFTVSALVTFVGVAVIIVGAFWLVIGVRAGGGAAVLAPAIVIVLAGVVALVWPGIALVFVAVLGGIVMLLLGASLVWTALALRRALG